MAELSAAFASIGMVSGIVAILVMFVRSEKVLPEFTRPMEMLSVAVLLLLVAVSALTIDNALSLGTLPELLAGGMLMVATAVLIHLVRSTERVLES